MCTWRAIQMKLRSVPVLIFLFCIFTNAYAGCGGVFGCYRSDVEVAAACTEGPCDKYMTYCQCTDDGWWYNECISHCKYCLAFGNVGGR